MKRTALVMLMIACFSATTLQARDYGQQGATFAIAEEDLLETIARRLVFAKSSGKLDAMNRDFARRSEARIRRPAPVAGLSHAEEQRVWDFDPSITIDHEIRDHKRNLISPAGRRVNPLDFVVIRQKLIFLDGDDNAQMAWAVGRYKPLDAKLILTSGAPIEAMDAHKRRFYFDQAGTLTAKFGIRFTPAVVEQRGKIMRITEYPVSARSGS